LAIIGAAGEVLIVAGRHDRTDCRIDLALVECAGKLGNQRRA
jgi:hypothetical protein